MIKLVNGAAKKSTARKLSRQAYCRCLGSRICHGNESLISGNNVSRIDLLVITELSGLPKKAIKHTDPVSCWAHFKTVSVAEIVTLNQHFLSPGKRH
jgi:hypothetical protein